MTNVGSRPAFGEHRGDQRRGRRLAVRARDRDALLEAASAPRASARAARSGCRARARRRLRDCRLRPRSTRRPHRRPATFAGGVADRDVDAHGRQAPGHRAFAQIRARDAIALGREHLGDAAHAGAADADEMHALDLVLHAAFRELEADVGDTRRAASGFAQPRARRAAIVASLRAVELARANRRGAAPLRSRCTTARAAPRSTRCSALSRLMVVGDAHGQRHEQARDADGGELRDRDRAAAANDDVRLSVARAPCRR